MKKLAILDDAENQLDLHKALLGMELDEHYEIETYQDPTEIIDEIDYFAQSIDALVTDYNMPNYNGIEVAESVLQKDESVPIIIYSGSNFDEIDEKLESSNISKDDLIAIEEKKAETEQYERMAGMLDGATI